MEALHYYPGNKDDDRIAKITWRLIGTSSSPPPELHFLTSNNSDTDDDCGQECLNRPDTFLSLPAFRSVSSAAFKERECIFKTSSSLMRSGRQRFTRTGTPTSSLQRQRLTGESDGHFSPHTTTISARLPLRSEGNISNTGRHSGGVTWYDARELLDLEVVQSILKEGRRYFVTRWSSADGMTDSTKGHWNFAGAELFESSYSRYRNIRFEANYISRRESSHKKEYLKRHHEQGDAWGGEIRTVAQTYEFLEGPILSSTLQSDSDSEETSSAGGADGCDGWHQVPSLGQERPYIGRKWPRRSSDGRQCRSTRHLNDLTKYKTELCRSYQCNSHCGYGDACLFAHGTLDLRWSPRHPMYRTKRCFSFHHKGYCLYASRCQFAHDIN